MSATIRYLDDAATKIDVPCKTTDYEHARSKIACAYCFLEVIDTQNEYIHPYMDFDGCVGDADDSNNHIKNIDDYNKVIDWLNTLSEIFGEYSVCGYTNDEQTSSQTHLAYIKKSAKYISFHVVFYTVKVLSKHFKEWINITVKSGVMPFLDANVYKFTTGRQLMRHGLTNKKIGKNRSITKGLITNTSLDATSQIITIRGDEPEVDITEFITHDDHTQTNSVQNKTLPSFNNTNTNDQLVHMTYNDLAELLTFIKSPEGDTTLETANVVAGNLANAGHVFTDLNKLSRVVWDWFNNRGEWKHHEDMYASRILESKYNSNQPSNQWFYSLLKLIPDETIRKSFANKHVPIMNTDVSDAGYFAPESTESTESTELVQYVSINEFKKVSTTNEVVALLKKCLINAIHLKCFLSRLDNETIQVFKPDELNYYLETVGVSKKCKSDVREALMKHTTSIKHLRFTDIFSHWKYNKYTEQDTVDYEASGVNKWYQCVLTNTFNNDEQTLKYALKREAYILRNPGKLSKVCFILQGLEGTGKNYYEHAICKLHDGFSDDNIELSKVAGKFNSIALLKTRVCANEALDATGRYEQNECMKKLITEETGNYEKKGIDSFRSENNMNIDITTNNIKPVLISPTDRRYCVVRTNPENANNRKYWSEMWKLTDDANDEFYYALHHFICFKNYDEHFLELDIPITEAKKEIQRLSANSTVKFIIDNYDKLMIGFSRDWLKNMYSSLKKDDMTKYSEQSFISSVLSYCEEYREMNKRRYRLCDNVAEKFDDLVVKDDVCDEEDIIESDEEQQKVIDEMNELIVNIRNEESDYYYILCKDLPKNNREVFVEHLLSNGWVYRATISYTNKKRGYKLVKQQ